MSSAEYKITVWRWLGMKLGGNSPRCTGCGIVVENDLGDHALICSFGKGRIYRHDLLRNWIAKELSAACCDFIVEKKHLLDDKKRPADIFIKNWSGGENVAADIGITSVVRSSILAKSHKERLAAATQFAAKKSSFYLSDCNEKGFSFIPLVIETTGGWAKESRAFLNILAERLAAKRKVPLEKAKCSLFRSLSSILQKGNARSILNHVSL